jgi:uncharacterized membrane protein YccF (DUF307 family)
VKPFGTIVVPAEYTSVWKTGFNLLWFVLFGWIVGLIHLLLGLILMCTGNGVYSILIIEIVIGIPLALEHFRLLAYTVSPFGRTMIVRE